MRRHHRPPRFPTVLKSVAVAIRVSRQERWYLLHVVQLDEDLVKFAVGKLAHYISVLVVWLLAGGLLLAAAAFSLIVFIHKVIFVVGIISANVDVAEGVCECFGRRGLKILQEGLECTWMVSWSVRRS